jgi:hypothetical protein
MAKGKQTALAKRDTGGLTVASWMQECAEEARNLAATFRQGVPRISFKGGIIRIDKEPVKDNKLQVLVIETAFDKAYYAGEYEEDEKQTPACYSFHPADKPMDEAHGEMIPHDACPDKQNEKCQGCPHNRFGTAERGDGKRCKDGVRLLVVMPDKDPESIIAGQVRMATLPPGSLKNWGDYNGKLGDMGITYRHVVTEISTEPFKGAYKVTFKAISTIEKEQYEAVKARMANALSILTLPYPTLGNGEDKEQRKADKAKSKKRAKKIS